MNNLPVSVTEWAEWFWRRARMVEPFPRHLEEAISRALNIVLVKLSPLDLHTVYRWAEQNGIPIPLLLESNRPLYACLLAQRGRGIIFQEGAVTASERRFSLAHELAHFLLDHLAPRFQAEQRLGKEIRPVLDGDRPPTSEQRLNAVLAGVPLGSRLTLMERDEHSLALYLSVLRAEDQADRLALELLAPAAEVSRLLNGQSARWSHDVVCACLVESFGLPDSVVGAYADYLIHTHAPRRTFRDWFEEKV